MNSKESILSRIRSAVATPAPRPGAGHGNNSTDIKLPTGQDHIRVLPAVGKDSEAQLALFQKNAIELKADFRLVKDMQDLAAQLASLRDTEKWTKAGAASGEMVGEACKALNLPLVRTDQPYNVADLESCSVGITECDALVAQTGSVLVTSRSTNGRAVTVLPPHHVVIARKSQMVATLPDAFALVKTKYGGNFPSMISFITGPSRTGDIERILVLGAHGPKKLTIFCL